jgi:hypothetical protein
VHSFVAAPVLYVCEDSFAYEYDRRIKFELEAHFYTKGRRMFSGNYAYEIMVMLVPPQVQRDNGRKWGRVYLRIQYMVGKKKC